MDYQFRPRLDSLNDRLAPTVIAMACEPAAPSSQVASSSESEVMNNPLYQGNAGSGDNPLHSETYEML